MVFTYQFMNLLRSSLACMSYLSHLQLRGFEGFLKNQLVAELCQESFHYLLYSNFSAFVNQSKSFLNCFKISFKYLIGCFY